MEPCPLGVAAVKSPAKPEISALAFGVPLTTSSLPLGTAVPIPILPPINIENLSVSTPLLYSFILNLPVDADSLPRSHHLTVSAVPKTRI